ncbi:MAG: MBL fold metallo-hydrolase [Deltaproteobacteria bacterium]|nr:MAG: MBL fold metallo-hydrolase [Deltaproteobacteria bacterium]
MRIRFLGAAGTVTGSRTLVTRDQTRLLVDCGMFQGYKQLRLRNWQSLEVDPASLDAVVLTHAHIDHSGWLPALVRDGFHGPIHCTAGTAELLRILLPDSGRIQEEDAAYANRKGHTRHRPARPMYTEQDALRSLRQVVPHGWQDPVTVGPLSVRFHRVGHILGAASVRVADADTDILFSGDIGRDDDLVMLPPATPPAADHVVVESTYGNRHHAHVDILGALKEVVGRTVERGGVVLIPAFAVGRAQAVLWALHVLVDRGEIPRVPTFLDSPMAVDTTRLYRPHADDLRLSPDQITALCEGVTLSRSLDESKAINDVQGPAIIVAASGMLTGGRILHHIAQRAPAKRNTLLFVGYQAPGTRGARLLAGERRIKIHGQYVKVRCEVASIDGLSAHADCDGLMGWMRRLPTPPRRVWVNHGDPESVDALRVRIGEELGWAVEPAVEGLEWDLAAGGPPVRVGPEPAATVLPPGRAALEEELFRLGIRGTVLTIGGPSRAGREAALMVAGTDDPSAALDALQALRAGHRPEIPVLLVGRRAWEPILTVGLPGMAEQGPPLALVDEMGDVAAILRQWR